jgi:carbon storage regulator
MTTQENILLGSHRNNQGGFMLVLSRKTEESIIIGDNIRITIVRIAGDKVRVGIEAPPDISVHRQEVYEAIQNERQRGQ